jgi:hypothetical protein
MKASFEVSNQSSHRGPVARQFAQLVELDHTQQLLWVNGQLNSFELLKVETLVCLVRYYHSQGENNAVVEAAVIAVNQRIRVAVASKRLGLTEGPPTAELSHELASLLWTQVFDAKRPWAEICFWRVFGHLLTDLLRQSRKQASCSIDSDLRARSCVLKLRAQGLPLEVSVDLRRRLMQLKPNQRRALLLRVGYGLSVRKTAAILHRHPRSVANLVRAAKRRLRDH